MSRPLPQDRPITTSATPDEHQVCERSEGNIKVDVTNYEWSYQPTMHVTQFLPQLSLQCLCQPEAMSNITHQLMQLGFDTPESIALAKPNELAHAGITNQNDQSTLLSYARQHEQQVAEMNRSQRDGASTISHWLHGCGIPLNACYEYSEALRRLNYCDPLDLWSLQHDREALMCFRHGHARLVACRVASLDYPQEPIYDVGSTQTSLQPVDLHASVLHEFDNELDDKLVDAFLHQMPTVSYARSSNSASETAYAPGSNVPMEIIYLIDEAVNQAHPNPCRNRQKIQWKALSNGKMKGSQFAPLTQYTAEELESAYRQTRPSGRDCRGGSTFWSTENRLLLYNAVEDPRCRHLGKVCWEMIANGDTGVKEYEPLRHFSASQLRSRHRSLWGDKRPQRLREQKAAKRRKTSS